MGNIEDIKKFLSEEKIIMGMEKTMKSLKDSKLEKIYLASTVSDEMKKEFSHLSSINNVKITELKIPSDELGAVCKKPFSVSVLGVLKA